MSSGLGLSKRRMVLMTEGTTKPPSRSSIHSAMEMVSPITSRVPIRAGDDATATTLCCNEEIKESELAAVAQEWGKASQGNDISPKKGQN